MKLDIKKVSRHSQEFKIEYRHEFYSVDFYGTFFKESSGFLIIDATIAGELLVTCDLSSEQFFEKMDEKLRLKVSQDIFQGFDEEYDVIEEESGIFDLYQAGLAEIESALLGYHKKPEYLDKDLEYEIK